MSDKADNLRLWNKHADIDPKFTRPIQGKAYRGTSPNPQYVIRCLTDLFGPAGEGFGWDVLDHGFQPLGDEVLHWCRIRFWHGDGRDFEEYGQTKALQKTRNGMMLDEDAPKKSLTDAIVKAASRIGVAANIFLGLWDDAKYVQDVAAAHKEKQATDRDPAKIRDALASAIGKADSIEAIDKLEAGGKFADALKWLLANDEPKGLEIKKAIADRRAELAPVDDEVPF